MRPVVVVRCVVEGADRPACVVRKLPVERHRLQARARACAAEIQDLRGRSLGVDRHGAELLGPVGLRDVGQRQSVTVNCVLPSPYSVGQPALVHEKVRENPEPQVWAVSVSSSGEASRLEQYSVVPVGHEPDVKK